MTRHRSFKRLVRARMEKTGESYTAARASLLGGEEETETGKQPVLATTDARIRARTGRGWEEWFDRLDEWARPSSSTARSRGAWPRSSGSSRSAGPRRPSR